jgi:hypothetical protein
MAAAVYIPVVPPEPQPVGGLDGALCAQRVGDADVQLQRAVRPPP